MSDTALLVIDVQNGMFANPDMQPQGGDAFLERLNTLVARARSVNVPVIFIQHDGGEGHPLEKPLPNWEIHPGTGFRPGDDVVEKRECDSFQGTSLQERLAGLGVSRLVIAGMMTEYCVDTTCRRAFSLGFKLILASDAHSTFSTTDMSAEHIIGHHNRVLDGSFGTVQSSASIDFQTAEHLA